MEKKKLIIGLIGEMACGKGLITRYLAEKYDSATFKYSSFLRELLDSLNVEKSRKNLSIVGAELRKIFGNEVISRAVINSVIASDKNIIIIDGLRTKDDLESFQHLSNFILLAVEADPKIRYQRLVTRNENAGDAEKSFEEFMDDTRNGIMEKEIVATMAEANEKVVNDTTVEDLNSQLDELMKKYKVIE